MNRALKAALEASPEGRRYLRAMASAKKRGKARAAARPARSSGPTKAERDARWDAYERWVYDAVRRLSGGRCEHCGKPLAHAEGDPDHVKGGRHRRQYTRILWVRRLCRACHDERTATKHPKTGAIDPAYWEGQQAEVLARRLAEHGADMLFALYDEEERRLAEADPRRKLATVPVRIEEASRGRPLPEPLESLRLAYANACEQMGMAHADGDRWRWDAAVREEECAREKLNEAILTALASPRSPSNTDGDPTR